MGYYSEVAIGLRKKGTLTIQKLIKKVNPDSYIDNDDSNWKVFHWTSVKWYSSSKDVQAVEEALAKIPGEAYSFLRVGEEPGDIEMHGKGDAPFTVESTIYFY